MQFYRCVCGTKTAWTSMGVAPCTACPKCGSDLAESPSLHQVPIAHTWVTRYDQTTGVPHERCQRCLVARGADSR